MGGKASRDKGGRFERWVVNRWRKVYHWSTQRIGWHASCGQNPGDVILTLFSFDTDGRMPKPYTGQGLVYRVECKDHKRGFQNLYNYMDADDDVLIVKKTGLPPLAVLRLEDYESLLRGRLPEPRRQRGKEEEGQRPEGAVPDPTAAE